jgi:hypothetical protein
MVSWANMPANGIKVRRNPRSSKILAAFYEAGHLKEPFFLLPLQHPQRRRHPFRIQRMVHEDQGAAREAAHGRGEPDRQGLNCGAVALEDEAVEAELTRSEGAAEAEGLVEEGEAEIREERPHGAPAPGEDAGPSRVCGVVDQEEDDEQKFVRERADSVLPGGGRSALRGDPTAA